MGSTLGAITDKTFLSSMHDMLTAFSEEGPATGKLLQFAGNFVVSWMPNIVRSTGKTLDPYQREIGIKGKPLSEEYFADYLNKQKYQVMPFLAKEAAPMPRVDAWGGDVLKGGAITPESSMWYRLTKMLGIPISLSATKNIDRMVTDWNNGARYKVVDSEGKPSAAYYYPRPQKSISTGQKTVLGNTVTKFLTDEQYQQYCKLIGQKAAQMVQNQSFNLDSPTLQDINRLKQVRTEAQRQARILMLLELRKAQ
jgi:hypothetical protein